MTEFLEELPPNIKEIAKRASIITPEDALLTPEHKLLLFKECSEEDIKILKAAAAKMIAPKPVTAVDLLKPPLSDHWSRISYGCSALDRCTRGGVATRGITEICGAAGVGKTQILLQLGLMVQLPKDLGGLGKGVAFLCTEGPFPTKRLFQLAKAFEQRHPDRKIDYLRNVHIEHVLESDHLLESVTTRLASLMSSISIGLIVIDSVAAVFRQRTDYIERAKDMRKLANALLYYSDKYSCAVICVNQVSTSKEIPTLGLAWSCLGRTRIKISRLPKQIPNKMGQNANSVLTIRKFEVMYSPESPNESAEFLITAHGIEDVH